MTTDLATGLAALEGAFPPGPSPEELRRLGSPAHLELLFRLEMCALVRRGPSPAPPAPAHLLAAAGEAAAGGALPAGCPGGLRALLEDLETAVRRAGAWDAGAPLWWSPLPPPGTLEALWRRLAAELLRPPEPPLLAAALAAGAAEPWLSLPGLLAPTGAAELHRELDRAHRDGALPLEREGVGAAGQVSARRTDSVAYVSGLEPQLLAAAPTFAALVQHCLGPLARRLARALPGRRLSPPQKAMVARYPAPCAGYLPHLDNPGAGRDNGRALTLVLYLSSPGQEPRGGDLALWPPGARTTEAPALVLPPAAGTAALFDSRAVPHRVMPVGAGPPRWALTLWFNDKPAPALEAPRLPRLTLTDALLPVADPPLPAGTALFHDLDRGGPAGEIAVRPRGRRRPRVGIVATVYRGGRALDAWCEHHLSVGADHLILVFDRPDEPEETADRGRLRARYSEDRLTLWSGPEVTARRWPALGADPGLAGLRELAGSGAASSYSVAARQTLHASAALAAARAGEVGGAPLDWLLHLDADELLYPEGRGRGGGDLTEHLAAADRAGLLLLRYANHELLLPQPPGEPPRFKLNPRLAAARLGRRGWEKLAAHLGLSQAGPRPYFHGYHNGKSAVAVSRGRSAAGVHGWHLEGPEDPDQGRFLAGPCVLHFHFASAAAFRRKYLAIAAAPAPSGPRPFEPSPAEVAALELIHRARGESLSPGALAHRLDHLHARLTTFSPTEIDLLEEAGLLLHPRLSVEMPLG